jgi:hypothetical protein
MKKTATLTIAIFACLSLSAQNKVSDTAAMIRQAMNGVKSYQLEGNLQMFQALYDCVENSNEPHSKVEAVKKWLLPQLQKQIADTTGKK